MTHSCAHHPVPQQHQPSFHRSFAIGVALNSFFVVIEIYYGMVANSLALLADAIHNFGDVLSLLLAWLGYYLAFRKPSKGFTYGLGRVSIYATLLNGVSLVVTALWILYEAYLRFNHPILPDTHTVAAVAAVGIVINSATAWVLMRGQRDVNIKGAMLHMFADAGVSLGVVIAAFLIGATGWLWLDPTVSSLISVIILVTSWPVLREGLRLSLDAVPQQLDRQAIHDFLQASEGVHSVHDLHVWGLSTLKTAMTAHIAIKAEYAIDDVMHRLHRELKDKFEITHVTIQVERDHSSCTDEHELVD
jgi:cobalt-zinc-cadmium efflux system protein